MRPLTVAAAVLLMAGMTGPALALKEGDPVKDAKGNIIDPFVVSAVYVPGQVYAVHLPQGQTTIITLGATETAMDAWCADKTILRADPVGNTVVIYTGATSAPIAPRSMIIRSQLADGKPRTYLIMLDTQPVDGSGKTPEINFQFRYPAEEAAQRASVNIARWKQASAWRAEQAAKAALSSAAGAPDTNFKYVLQGETPGDWNLLPTREVSDNNTETHFHFPGDMQIPLIYTVDSCKKPVPNEAVTEPTFNNETGIATVHQLSPAFLLRKGDDIMCILNRAYDPVGTRGQTGTISTEVERVIR